MVSKFLENMISTDNTQKVKYVVLFFVFFIALSQNIFQNLFGCRLNEFVNNIYIRHLVCILFLFLLIDVNLAPETKNDPMKKHNPILSVFYTISIYVLVFLLLHCNKIYVLFAILIVSCLVILDRIKEYYVSNISDQEILQEHLGFIFKMNNVFVIIMVLTIIIGTISSLDVNELMKTLKNHVKSCR